MNRITAYTDGSAVLKYPFKGGFGVYIKAKKNYKIRKGFVNTKTGRMELTAALTCLKYIRDKKTILTIYSDSMYVVNTCNQWIDNWENQCWLNKKNIDLLKQLIVELRNYKRRPKFIHIKGHQKESKENTEEQNLHIRGNNQADRLADYKTQKSYQVDVPFTDLTEIEKEDFKEINGKLYYKPEEEILNDILK